MTEKVFNPFTGKLDYTGIDPDLSGYVPKYQSAEADANISAGMAVYMTGAGHIDKAQADASGTSSVVGLLSADVSTGFSGQFQKDGAITLADWTAVIGSTDLTVGAIYFLDPSTAGMLTTIAPTAIGEYVCVVGQAITTKILAIEIQPKILL